MKINGTDRVSSIVVSSPAPSISMVAVAGRFLGCFALRASNRDDALVVVDWREQSVGLITLAWLALIKVRTNKLYAMMVLVVDECPDGVTRCSAIIGNGRPRRKAQAWRCADC